MPEESPEFFPPSGSFQSVVPLSELAETPDAVGIRPPAPTPTAPQAKRVADGIQARRVGFDENGRQTPEDEEEETLVPMRRSLSTSALAPPTARRKSRLPSWRFIVPCLAALVAGGVIGDALWKNLRRAGEGVEPAHVAAEQPPVVEAPDAQPLPEAGAADASEPETTRPEPVEAENESGGPSPRDARAVRAEITSATVTSASPAKRAAVERPAAESRATRTTPGRGAGDRSPAERRAERPEVAPARRAREPRSPVVTSASRDQSLPVFSPPSNKSGKKDVIQWP